MIEYSIQTNHLHLIVEAENREAVSRGMRGLGVRVARALNKLWKRRGKVFAERYHDVPLKAPRQVRNALVYVLNNCYHHGERPKDPIPDPLSSGRWFGGWKDFSSAPGEVAKRPLPQARSYRLRKLWQRHGLIHIREGPSTA